MVRLLIGATLLLQLYCIVIPLQNNYPRCMIVYAFNEKETVKLDVKFPPIPDQQAGEHYEIYFRNTDNNETVYESSQPGPYKKELEVKQSTRRVIADIVYEVCFYCTTTRVIGWINMEYTAMTEFYFQQSEIKVPEHILKSQDLTETYLNAQRIKDIGQVPNLLMQRFREMQDKRAQDQQVAFQETREVGQKVALLSIIEFVFLAVAAIFQLFVLRSFLIKQSYI